jgi:hypothetical protein
MFIVPFGHDFGFSDRAIYISPGCGPLKFANHLINLNVSSFIGSNDSEYDVIHLMNCRNAHVERLHLDDQQLHVVTQAMFVSTIGKMSRKKACTNSEKRSLSSQSLLPAEHVSDETLLQPNFKFMRRNDPFS